MPYKDREKKRKYQKKWVKAKRVRHRGFDTKDLDGLNDGYGLQAGTLRLDADGDPIYEEGLCR